MKRRGAGQRLALACAFAGYSAGVATALGAAWWAVTRDTGDAIFASLAAGTVFLVGAGIVLHVIGTADLPDLRVRGDSER